MPNLTITVDEQVLKKARIRALEDGTSVNALLRSYLEQYVRDVDTRKKAIKDILAVSRTSRAAGGGRRATRDELHERDT
jgi:plasmid stability protein